MDKFSSSSIGLEPGKANAATSSGSLSQGSRVELLEKLKQGDEGAFREVFARWEEPLYFFLFKFTGSQQDAEDISQETFTKLWVNRDKIDTSQNINHYIFHIAKQLSINHLRNLQRRGEVVTATPYDGIDQYSTEQDFAVREMELIVDLCIGKLPPRVREVYELHYKEGLSNEEIARKLGITANNVASHIYTAREKLRQALPLLALLFLINLTGV